MCCIDRLNWHHIPDHEILREIERAIISLADIGIDGHGRVMVVLEMVTNRQPWLGQGHDLAESLC